MSRLCTDGAVGKEVCVRDWVRRKLGSIDHELRVVRLAKMLFELTRRWHGLGNAECRLLVLGALMHDVGRALGAADHAKRGARMIQNSTTLRLTDGERRRLAYLTRYHRGRVPENGEEALLEPTAGDDMLTMRVLLGILRAADSLDSRSRGGPRLVITVRGRVLTLYGYVKGEISDAQARYGKPKKFHLLESMLHCQVRTEWFSTELAALVG